MNVAEGWLTIYSLTSVGNCVQPKQRGLVMTSILINIAITATSLPKSH